MYNYGEFSTELLVAFHELAWEALKHDDSLPQGEKKYGVREYPDWRKHILAMETELKNRKIPFNAISI